MQTVVRLMREVTKPGRSGPENGQYALQKVLRARAPEWLKIGGALLEGEVPWWWCWLDRPSAVQCAREGRPFVMGPNMLFEIWDVACGAPGERELCDASSCVLQFTESRWYRDWIAESCGPQNRAPIILWPYPIAPQPAGPLPAEYDLLIYAKSGHDMRLIEALRRRFPRSCVLRYGRYRRKVLYEAARRCRACAYLSKSDRGPLALAEIMLAGCPAVGMPKGAPWILEGVTGWFVDRLEEMNVLDKIGRALELDRQAVRSEALKRFDTRRITETILSSLEGALRELGGRERPQGQVSGGADTANRHFHTCPTINVKPKPDLPPSAQDSGRGAALGPGLGRARPTPVRRRRCRLGALLQPLWRRLVARRTRAIKAAMVTANLSLGGAERWVVDLIKHSNPRRLQWTGMAVSSLGAADRSLAIELRGRVKLYANRRKGPATRHAKPFYWPAIHEITGLDFRQTIRLAALGTDVVVTWGQPDLRYWLESCGVPRVLCSHTTLKEPGNAPLTGVTHLAAVSEAAMAYFDGREGLEGLPRTVLYNGADPQRCKQQRGRRAIRAAWGLKDRDVVIGYLGRQSEEKNPMAPALAVGVSPDSYHAIYYGAGPAGNGFCPSTTAWCEAAIPRHFQMHQPVAEVGDVLRGFDVLMLASRREAFSLALIEAWLVGVPVVATPVGSIPELERKFGPITVPVPLDASPEDLRCAVEQAIHSSRRAQLVARARRIAGKHFTVRAMADRWMGYLANVVTGTVK